MKRNYKEITIATTCPFCGAINNVAVNVADLCDWRDGALVQDAFPYLTAEEREALVSGICPKCWDNMIYGEEEEEEEDWEDDVSEIGYNPYLGCYDDDC